ncbi:hypothetical protein GYA28_01960 [Candidatus Roizmanbacteria bacterium]|nr:hypothetical protein [Candidatus Roizmanbacteria bacterium]
MSNKKGPSIFIIALFVVLFFVVGVRYGQNVEKTNKKIECVLSITPTKQPPTPEPIKYQEYRSKKWGLRFTLPTNLEIKESATLPAILFEPKK